MAGRRVALEPVDHAKVMMQTESDSQSMQSASSRMFGINTSDSNTSRNDDDNTSLLTIESRSKQSKKLPVIKVYIRK